MIRPTNFGQEVSAEPDVRKRQKAKLAAIRAVSANRPDSDMPKRVRRLLKSA